MPGEPPDRSGFGSLSKPEGMQLRVWWHGLRGHPFVPSSPSRKGVSRGSTDGASSSVISIEYIPNINHPPFNACVKS